MAGGADLTTTDPFAGLGPEADTLDLDGLARLLAGHSMRLHGFLRDQHILAGRRPPAGQRGLLDGRSSRRSPTPSKLTEAEAERLVAAIGECVDESLAYERGRPDMSSSADRPGAVHRREGEACPVCGDTIRAVEYHRYTVNYCPTCQTGGKVLADNTTSKFLK